MEKSTHFVIKCVLCYAINLRQGKHSPKAISKVQIKATGIVLRPCGQPKFEAEFNTIYFSLKEKKDNEKHKKGFYPC